MFQPIEPAQLEALSLEALETVKAEAIKREEELQGLKTKGGKNWTDALQDELNEVGLCLVDIDEIIESKKNSPALVKPEEKKEAPYVVPTGSEQCVHLALLRGTPKTMYDPETGELRKPFVQMFSLGEWELFKKHYQGLGFVIVKVLHDPFGDASKYVYKKPIKK